MTAGIVSFEEKGEEAIKKLKDAAIFYIKISYGKKKQNSKSIDNL